MRQIFHEALDTFLLHLVVSDFSILPLTWMKFYIEYNTNSVKNIQSTF